MNSPRRHEMDKLQAIQRQTEAVQQRLDERLPQQRRNLAAFVSFYKWRLQTQRNQTPQVYTQEIVDATAKKLRVEVGAFEYAAKEQSELLTRALFQLDDILSNGDSEIKDTRKTLVVKSQKLLEQADALNAKAASLKQFTEGVISRLPTVPSTDIPMEETTEDASVETPAEAPTEPTQMEDDEDEWEHVNASDVQPLFHEEDDDEVEDNDESTEQPKEDIASPASEEDVPMEDEAPPNTPVTATQEEEAKDEEEEEEDDEEEEDEPEGLSIDASSLPVWRPYYQIQKRADGIYVVANLRGVDPRHVRVEAMPQNGVLRISGIKLPTQKDLLLTRLSGAPTFGRFEIVERFPTQTLSLENASQQLLRDGTLQVRLPFYFVQHPRILRRMSPFQPHRLMVW